MLNNHMETGPSWAAGSYSATQIRYILWDLQVDYVTHKSATGTPFPSQNDLFSLVSL
jgi:hypothetical protein